MLYFVSGGVRSGKSTYAEKLVNDNFKNRKVYIATARITDEEMKKRVLKHQLDRKNDNWETIEQPNNLSMILDKLNDSDVVLIDCLTIWLSNEMFGEIVNLDVVEKIYETVKKINSKVKDLVIVSNDIFSGVNNYDELTKAYLSNLGDLHIKIVASADYAYECISGLAIKRKG